MVNALVDKPFYALLLINNNMQVGEGGWHLCDTVREGQCKTGNLLQ